MELKMLLKILMKKLEKFKGERQNFKPQWIKQRINQTVTTTKEWQLQRLFHKALNPTWRLLFQDPLLKNPTAQRGVNYQTKSIPTIYLKYFAKSRGFDLMWEDFFPAKVFKASIFLVDTNQIPLVLQVFDLERLFCQPECLRLVYCSWIPTTLLFFRKKLDLG